ncbi:hypothetical protein GW17_00060056 [Ensete ventricosum]|nr:hypothetical protein GW17_00060056 [Ensete ventricosum]
MAHASPGASSSYHVTWWSGIDDAARLTWRSADRAVIVSSNLAQYWSTWQSSRLETWKVASSYTNSLTKVSGLNSIVPSVQPRIPPALRAEKRNLRCTPEQTQLTPFRSPYLFPTDANKLEHVG